MHKRKVSRRCAGKSGFRNGYLGLKLTPNCSLDPKPANSRLQFPRCILCPPPDLSSSPAHATTAAPSTPEKSTGRGRAKAVDVPIPPLPPPLTALDAVKPTECNNWTHLICAVWMPEVLFSDTERMKMVEGAGNLPVWRYSAVSDLYLLTDTVFGVRTTHNG